MHEFRVGELYHRGCTVWPEANNYNFRGGAHELLLCLRYSRSVNELRQATGVDSGGLDNDCRQRYVVDMQQPANSRDGVIRVEAEVHRVAKAQAAMEGKSLREVVTDLLRRWIADRKAV